MIVVDTNVILQGVRAFGSASGYVLRGMLDGTIGFAATPAVILEYEDVLKRPSMLGNASVASRAEIDVILDALCLRARETYPWFRFRPFLNDPKDDIFVECALAAGARIIVTGDRHFRHRALRAFGLRTLSSQAYVAEIRHEGRAT